MKGFTSSDLRRPTSYLEKFQAEQNKRQHLEGRVERLELERDALSFRLQQAEEKLRQMRAMVPPAQQGKLEEVGA